MPSKKVPVQRQFLGNSTPAIVSYLPQELPVGLLPLLRGSYQNHGRPVHEYPLVVDEAMSP